jgi:hypothetical protein
MQELFDCCVLFAEMLKHPFAEGGITPGNTKMVLFRNCKRAFEKNMSHIESMDLRTLTNEEPFSRTDEIISCSLNNKELFRIGILSDLLDEATRLEIGTKLCKIICPRYGIFYKFPFVFSPWTYACGLTNTEYDDNPGIKFYNPKHKDIIDRISLWRRSQNQHVACELGFLREIYPINFINEGHLSHEVFPKTTLRDWIKAADHRGTLEKITGELWSWIIPEDDLYRITVDLAPTGILLCVNKENPQRYDYGVRPEDQVV